MIMCSSGCPEIDWAWLSLDSKTCLKPEFLQYPMKQNTRFTLPPALKVEFIFSSCKGRKNRAQVPYLCSLPLCITPSFNGRCFYFENQITGRPTQYLAYVLYSGTQERSSSTSLSILRLTVFTFSFFYTSLAGSKKETRYQFLSPQVASVLHYTSTNP